mmetsp:Transcript_33010/g.77149  ORF Transcript_33010/g.77149 Transcript_33010/m.77149 type:complete len:466 (-) Transcript_33010:234-1631(-)|eukprot:CAMPEP_0178443824 /NCGR_PEP_ID=MMETSP0689_2-20121128/39124_1 /TAXON_ID=160604 /ORGANISM="Amphidinium massartii, Strain CS-259" /LENGTH=465 /DNA_ID=CAMNT_0020067903 /DNA_START=83 /DNA_END=1480 /DNA_ORIENTATION=-
MSATWEKAFREHVTDLPQLGGNVHYSKSADRLRHLMQKSPLCLTDLRDEPERFFLAHRIMSEFATRIGPGFSIRFTVQVNLFAGTILALGNPEQVAALKTMQEEGRLGCFCLTERLAGVNSGLVVNTTCVWDEGKQVFRVNCPDDGAKKNWISQGLTADLAVVVANLFVKGKSYGPHAFLATLRKDGKPMPGVSFEDMGDKTIGNDLDNARITFSNVELPKSALLDRYATIEGGEYKQRQAGVSNMEMIGQRLYTGRAVIAASTLVFCRSLYGDARQYADNKKCWHPDGDLMLSDVPQLASLYVQADKEISRCEKLRDAIELRLCECLRAGKVPDNKLVQMIAAFKVRAVETSIDMCFKLKQELGSYALMGGTGFDKLDYLQCCKFAEGDSRILMQKIARDRLQEFKKSQSGSQEEVAACMKLGQALMKGGKKAWNENWTQVYGLADLVLDRIMAEAAGPASSKL